jgi:hypothetical protein
MTRTIRLHPAWLYAYMAVLVASVFVVDLLALVRLFLLVQ